MGDVVVDIQEVGKVYVPSPPWMKFLLRSAISDPVVALEGLSLFRSRPARSGLLWGKRGGQVDFVPSSHRLDYSHQRQGKHHRLRRYP